MSAEEKECERLKFEVCYLKHRNKELQNQIAELEKKNFTLKTKNKNMEIKLIRLGRAGTR